MIYESLCHELDELLIGIRDDTQQQIEIKLQLEKIMNDGYLNIAKARYINGSSTVSTLQLPTEFSKPLQPLATIIREDSGGLSEFKVVRRSSVVNQSSDSCDDGVRQRRKNDELELDEKKDAAQPVTDPIRLFGVLVPQALRLAQKSFIEAVTVAATATEIQCRLSSKIERYSKLLEKKELILKKTSS